MNTPEEGSRHDQAEKVAWLVRSLALISVLLVAYIAVLTLDTPLGVHDLRDLVTGVGVTGLCVGLASIEMASRRATWFLILPTSTGLGALIGFCLLMIGGEARMGEELNGFYFKVILLGMVGLATALIVLASRPRRKVVDSR